MSVRTEIDRIIGAVEAAHLKVLEKGGTTARPFLVADLEEAIASIPIDDPNNIIIDYDLLAFDTSEIVVGKSSSTSSVLGQAILGQMVLA